MPERRVVAHVGNAVADVVLPEIRAAGDNRAVHRRAERLGNVGDELQPDSAGCRTFGTSLSPRAPKFSSLDRLPHCRNLGFQLLKFESLFLDHALQFGLRLG